MQNEAQLQDYYEFVQKQGNLLSFELAQRWSSGVLKTLGFHLNSRVKRSLAKALPEPLARDLKDVFFLLHFRDPNLSSLDFQKQVARRSGNTNAEFARFPTLAVFSGIQRYTNSKLNQRIAESLSPEVRELWEQSMEKVGV
ncbi:MAG: DUF2267 domain-containing protein [Candidatus Promineifilaceae bacterium]